MRVAFIGKGGSGKSLIAGTVARLAARRGDRVLALDMDTLPGLAIVLGMRVGSEGLPGRLADHHAGRWQVFSSLAPGALVAQHAAIGPDGLRLLTMGKLPGRVSPASSAVFRHVAQGFRVPGWSVIGDLAGGTRQAAFGWAGFADSVVLVVEPTAKGILSAVRLARLRPEGARVLAVASKVRGNADAARVRDALPFPLIGAVPYDERVREAEREGRAPIDAVPDAPAIAAIAAVLARLDAP